jgi:hypothetical protein
MHLLLSRYMSPTQLTVFVPDCQEGVHCMIESSVVWQVLFGHMWILIRSAHSSSFQQIALTDSSRGALRRRLIDPECTSPDEVNYISPKPSHHYANSTLLRTHSTTARAVITRRILDRRRRSTRLLRRKRQRCSRRLLSFTRRHLDQHRDCRTSAQTKLAVTKNCPYNQRSLSHIHGLNMSLTHLAANSQSRPNAT